MTAKPLAAVVWVVVVGALSTPTAVRGQALPIVTGVEPQRSAEWRRAAVDQCWLMKAPRIREAERGAAEAA